MKHPSTAREALIAEAIGDVAKLIDRIEATAPALNKTSEALLRNSAKLRDDLVRFEHGMAAITENAKVQTVKHMIARTDEATRRSIDEQSRAMAQAARVAFSSEFHATLQQLYAALRPVLEELQRPWERWLLHAATVAASSTATWLLTLYLSRQ